MSKTKNINQSMSDKKAEKILNQLNQENNKNKKEEKSMANNEWLKENGKSNKGKKVDKSKYNKITNKIVKIGSNVWSLKIVTFDKEYEFELKHKQTKRGNIKVRVQGNDIDTLKIKFKESKDVQYETIKVVNENGAEKEEKYELDYISINEDVIPFDILLSPVIDFYFERKNKKDIILYTEGNIKINDSRIIMDTTIRKMEYGLDSKALSVEDLQKLSEEDEDNKLGVSMEYVRRSLLSSDDENYIDVNKEEQFENEIKDLSLVDKIVATIEDEDPKLKEEIMSDDCEIKFEIIKDLLLNNHSVKRRINKILKDHVGTIENLNLESLGIKNMDQVKELIECKETNADKYVAFFKQTDLKEIRDSEESAPQRAYDLMKLMMEKTKMTKSELLELFKTKTKCWTDVVWYYRTPADGLIEMMLDHLEKVPFSA